jgi:hypothetical protein
VLLDEVAAALADGRIDRVDAHRVVGLALSERLPKHPMLSDAEREPLRSVDDDVRALVYVRLARTQRAALRPADVHRSDTGWRVSIVDASGNPVAEELLSFDLDAERAKPERGPGSSPPRPVPGILVSRATLRPAADAARGAPPA